MTYPFKGLGGVTVSKQHSGQRVYDINKDGVAHYGLYPDWLQDLRMVAGATGDSGSDGSNIVKDMSRGPEAYLQMWERAQGVSNDGCRDARALKKASVIRSLPHGASVKTCWSRRASRTRASAAPSTTAPGRPRGRPRT